MRLRPAPPRGAYAARAVIFCRVPSAARRASSTSTSMLLRSGCGFCEDVEVTRLGSTREGCSGEGLWPVFLPGQPPQTNSRDRERVGEGKGGAGRVDTGGRRTNKKKTRKKEEV